MSIRIILQSTIPLTWRCCFRPLQEDTASTGKRNEGNSYCGTKKPRNKRTTYRRTKEWIYIYTIQYKIKQIRIYRKAVLYWTVLHPTFPSCAARMSQLYCWPLYFLWHGNALSWYTCVTIISRARVEYEMIDSQLGATRLLGYNHPIPYPTSASGIIVLLKPPPKYRKLN